MKSYTLNAIIFALCIYTVLNCSCMFPGSPLEVIDNYTDIFTGKIESIEIIGDAPSGIGANQLKATFQVYTIYKGKDEATKVVYTADSSATCGIGFAVGQEWFIYANGGSKLVPKLSANICSRSKYLSGADEDVSALEFLLAGSC